MSLVPPVLRRAAARVSGWYRDACLRDDLHALGVRVPDGLWCCGACEFVSADAPSYRRHQQLAHAL